MLSLFKFSDEVEAALSQSRPIVALESTLITHGLPYPQNLEIAKQAEHAVRQQGAVPATIAIIAGEICVGMSGKQLAYLAQQPSASVHRCSRRNIAVPLLKRADGVTTVSGTMAIAHLAGIKVFATGAIGGAHLGKTYDVSSDLIELSRTPVTVVCSGIKPFLDIATTREMLESYSVPIIGFQGDDVAPFFQEHSGYFVDLQLNTIENIVEFLKMQTTLEVTFGELVIIPIDKDNRLPAETFKDTVRKTLQQANEDGIQGQEVTTWIVRALAKELGPVVFQSNIALLIQNATHAAKIAAKL